MKSWLKLIAVVLIGVPLAWLGLTIFDGQTEEKAAQSAAAQRHAKLASARHLEVNPNSLVGTWYGRAGTNDEMEITLKVTADTRGTSRNPYTENAYSSSAFGTIDIIGLGRDCNYVNVPLSGAANDKAIGLNGYLGFTGESGWEDTDRFSLGGQLEPTGMFGTLSTTHIETGTPYQTSKPGCPANSSFTFRLSLVGFPTTG